MQGTALMWQLAMLAQVVFDRRQRKQEGEKKNWSIKGKLWNISSEVNCLCRNQLFFSAISKKKETDHCFPLYCFVMAVKNSPFDWICVWQHLVILMDSLDAGPRLAGSIFFRCFFLMTLWKQATLYSRLNGELHYLTYCTATCQSTRMPMTIIGKDI